jgi:hypothetical protein
MCASEAKLNRGAKTIDTQMEGGRERAREFLEVRKHVVTAPAQANNAGQVGRGNGAGHRLLKDVAI